MKTTWHETTLGKLVDFQSGGTPSKGNPDFWNGSIPWVSAKDMKQLFLDDTEDHITTSAADDGAKQVPSGTVLMLTRGMTLLNDVPICIVRRSMSFNQDVKALRPKGDLDSRFLPYLLLGNKHRLLSMVDLAGHGTGRLNTEELKTLDVSLPSPTEQQAIACILGALDDKIELNRRRNRTLEAIARAIFQSWFVDFDPVKAKAAGRSPSDLSASVAALFPDRFADSPLGPIPTGWKTLPLYETARFVNGAAFRSDDFCDSSEGLPVVKIAELKDGLTAQTKFSKRDAAPDQRIDTGDLLYSWSGSPDTSLDAFLWALGPGLLNQHIFKVVTANVAQQRFAYYLLKSMRSVLVETARNKQTTGLGHVTVADMKRLQVCWPSSIVLITFDRLIAPIYDKAFLSTLEIQTLTALRDALLPKLISGELRVPDAERIVGRAT